MPAEPTFVGIDLGASALHVVTLVDDGDRLAVHDARVALPDALAGLDLDRAAAIAIDAPGEPSRGCHVADTTLSPKFRTARCGEIALGQEAGIWVPWTTPCEVEDAAPWMRVGFATWAECRRRGHEPIEVYPAGAFRVLAGGTIPPKTKPAGVAARRALLARVVTPPAGFAMWSHDGIDATVAAVTAAAHARGTATGHGHDGPGCEGTAVWLPPPLDRDPAPPAR
jgi:predicted nuclease with RNAse H fold